MNEQLARRRAQEADVFRAELERTYALLADALVLAASLAQDSGYETNPLAIMEVLGARRGFTLERPAWVEIAENRMVELAAIRARAEEPQLRAPEPRLDGPPAPTREPQLGARAPEPRLDLAPEPVLDPVGCS